MSGGQVEFGDLMAQVMAHAERFGHREHLHLTWLAVRAVGADEAVALVSDGIQRTARYLGAPQKYHATVSRAWVELVAHHLGDDEDDFDQFAAANPELWEKRILLRFYSSAVLASDAAKSGWVAPDLHPFPWEPTADGEVFTRA